MNQFAQKYGQISRGYVVNTAIYCYEPICTKIWAKSMGYGYENDMFDSCNMYGAY